LQAIDRGDKVSGTVSWTPADSIALRWGDNKQSCAVAVLAYRLAARGFAVRVAERDSASMRAGDYLIEASDEVRRAAAASAVEAIGIAAHEVPDATHAVRVPRIAIFGGAACAYPYYGYYAHSLASLGLPFDVLDGAPVAAGALDEFDLLMLPGGFEIWGLDRNESAAGIDAAIRRFIARGGACIASCGGAFYLSEGRPHWLGVARASPRYSHEYLRSGAGLVSIELDDGPLARGCAPIVEMPYYHGPIYEAVRAPTGVAARFCSLTLPARLPIDNPLDAARFTADMAGKAAILTTGNTARAVLFSAHPEMGDVVRKYIALDSYVAHYLPIRGSAVMEQTLDYYEPNDAPSFRLILNATDHLLAAHTPASPPPRRDNAVDASAWHDARARLLESIGQALGALAPADDPLGRLLKREIAQLRALTVALADVAVPAAGGAGAMRVLHDAIAALDASAQRPAQAQAQAQAETETETETVTVTDARSMAQDLLSIELPLRFLEAIARIQRCDSN
jgi:CobB/CobQ-like glutamine amidotransferase domain